jgi:hypothetical protein
MARLTQVQWRTPIDASACRPGFYRSDEATPDTRGLYYLSKLSLVRAASNVVFLTSYTTLNSLHMSATLKEIHTGALFHSS